jgi:hypothetical protein
MSAQWKGALTGRGTARRAPLALQRADAFSTAAAAPEITVWPGEFSGLNDEAGFGGGFGAGFGHQRCVERKHRCHGALALRNRKLHGASASLDRTHRIGEGKRAGQDVRRPFAERVTGGKRGRDAALGQHARRGNADGENCRLGIFRQAEVRFRPLEAQSREREAEGRIGFGESLSGYGKAIGEVAAHSNGLRALAGAEKSDFRGHFKEILSHGACGKGAAVVPTHRCAMDGARSFCGFPP